MILNKPSITKGAAATLTVDITSLAAHPTVTADAYFSDTSNWYKVAILFKSTAGNQTETAIFDATNVTPSSVFMISNKARDVFKVSAIKIYDFDGGYLLVNKQDLNEVEFEIDTVNPIVIKLIAPAKFVTNVTSQTVFNVTSSMLYEVGFKVRHFDFSTGLYGGDAFRTITAVNNSTNTITIDSPFTSFIENVNSVIRFAKFENCSISQKNKFIFVV